MPRYPDTQGIKRIIDANINRAKEGLRVCEEVARFILNSRGLTQEFKSLRHGINSITKRREFFSSPIEGRDSPGDKGRLVCGRELERKDYRDVFFANIQRVKESVRVLEEFSKLKDRSSALSFKRIRYAVYTLEKKTQKKLIQ